MEENRQVVTAMRGVHVRVSEQKKSEYARAESDV